MSMIILILLIEESIWVLKIQIITLCASW